MRHSLPQLTTVDANDLESKEVHCSSRLAGSCAVTLWLQTVELTAEKLDMLIQRLTQLQQALHGVA